MLIIGFGNSHRRDDGIGLKVVDDLKIHFGGIDNVSTISLRQLGPELVEDLVESSCVIFVDADQRRLPGGILWSRILPVTGMTSDIHSLTAGELLGLTKLLYKRCPPAWMVSVEGSDFGFGEALSVEAADNAVLAASEIAGVIRSCFESERMTITIRDHAGV